MKRPIMYVVMAMLVLMACGPLFTPVAADVEDNNTFEKAEQINTAQQGQVQTGTLNVNTADPADCYKFNPPGGSAVILNASVTPGDKVRYTLFDFNKAIIATSDFLAPSGTWVYTYLIGQQMLLYYLMVDLEQGGATGAGVYNFQISWPDQQDGDTIGDAGDDINSPKDISGKLHFNGTVGDGDTADFYSVQCMQGDQVHLTLGVVEGKSVGVMKFYGLGKNQMDVSPSAPAGEETKIDTLAPDAGTYYIEVYSSEHHNGTGIIYYVNASNIPKDTEPPTVQITVPTDGATLDHTTVVISGTAADNRGVARVDVKVNDGPYQETDGAGAWSKAMVLSVGQNTIKAMVTDTAGLNGTDMITVTVTGTGDIEDKVPPVITIVAPLDGDALAVPDLVMSGTASDDKGVLRVEVKVGLNGTWMVVPGTTAWDISFPLEMGANVIFARAVDNSGNTAMKQITVYRLIAPGADPAAPNVHFTDPVNVSALRVLSYTVKGTANDETAVLKVDISINNGPFVLAVKTNAAGTPDWSTWTFPAVFVNGTNNLTARAMDTSGNINFDYLTVLASSATSDTLLPEIKVKTPADGAILNITPTLVSGTAQDPQGGGVMRVDISLNNGPWQPAAGTMTWTYMAILVTGQNVIKIRVTDTSANVNTTQITVTYNATADLLAPHLIIESPKDNSSVISDKLDIKGSAGDNINVTKVELTLNGNKMAVTGIQNWKSRVTLKEGKNTIVATASDAAGNTHSQTITVTYKKAVPKPPIAGFELVFLLGAVGLGAFLLGRQRRA